MRVLVYDLGGGTFDVTILELDGDRFRTLATDGDVCLGGKDFDERLVNYFAEQFAAAQGVDPRSDPQDAAQLWLDAQEAKHTLSERSKATVVCVHAGIRMRIDVTREQFENLTRDLVERTETTASLVVRQAKLDWSHIDRVLLVGGSGRMPMIGRMLQNVTGKEPDCSLSPDEVVAHGAALYATMLVDGSIGAAKASCDLINVNSHSLGVVGMNPRTRQKTNVVLIPKNTALPCRVVRTFRTAQADRAASRWPSSRAKANGPRRASRWESASCAICRPACRKTRSSKSSTLTMPTAESPWPRVPSVRYSQRVEIQRDTVRNLSDLGTWRAQLCGQPEPVPAGLPESGGGADGLLRLDVLYRGVGKLAVGAVLPAPLTRSRQNAVAAAAQLAAAEAKAGEAERARQAGSGGDAIRLDALLAQANDLWQQAQVQSDFAHLVLGRDCVQAGFEPPGARKLVAEIRKLLSERTESDLPH